MKRAPKGAGSYFRLKDGRWAYDYIAGRTAFGKPIRRRITGKAQSAVRDRALAIQHAIRTGTLSPEATSAKPIARWLVEDWLPAVYARRREATAGDYERTVRKYLVPWLRARRWRDLKPADLEAWYRELAAQGVGPRAIAKIHAVGRVANGYAVRTEEAHRNVFAMLEPPEYEPAERVPYSIEETRRFLAACRGHQGEALFVAALFVQCRSGELLALAWSDVDLTAATVAIERTMTDDKRARPTIGTTTKTKAGRRIIAIPKLVVEALRAHRKAQLAHGQRGGLVFPNRVGKPLSRSNVLSRWLHPIQRAAGLPEIAFHDLRHTGATILRALGADLDALRDRLGHESIETTSDLYVHLDLDVQRRLSAKLDEAFGTDG